MLFGAPTRARAILSPILATLKPSFLRRSSHTVEPRRLHRTSYLDGLRGVAALFVVFAHYEATYFPSLNPAWHAGFAADASVGGAEGVEHHNNNNFLQLPIVRAMYAGPFMVAIFFVISGHVLSQKALGLAKRRLYSDLLKSLASSVFRRWFRLMLPALASSFLFFLFVQCGWATKLSPNWDADHAPVSEPLYDPKDETLSAWAADVLSLTNPFRFGEVSFPRYNYPLWTMPVEYMGSMIIFVVVTGTSLVRPVLRLAVLAALVVYCMWMARWEWCLFISGVLLADVYDKSSPDYVPIPMLPLTSCIDGEVEEDSRRT
ncbi:acyltransferase family-domain-containing protein, partial [Bisporella sp. PMI_857]